ncbi:Uncharacterised protein [Xylophilus ampelinus]|nr:hypothetical protein [Variovorax sp.]VTY37145.1 Uncharacterised protein [Xylophilus ampelinus]
MPILNPEVDYPAELRSLRKVYVDSTPWQRYGIIKRRLAHEEIGPVRMCTMVSAVEALARSIVLQHEVDQGADRDTVYRRIWRDGPQKLTERALAIHGRTIESAGFAGDAWALFLLANEFRNLVMHECTYLGQDKFPSLIAGAENVLAVLVRTAGLEQ